jgi:hypothetical protein
VIAQVEFRHVFVGQQSVHRDLQYTSSLIQDLALLADLQRLLSNLLHHEHRTPDAGSVCTMSNTLPAKDGASAAVG